MQKSGFPKIRDLSPAAPRGVYIARNDPKQKYFLEMSENIKHRHFLIKWLPLLCIFIDFLFPPPPHSDSHPCIGLRAQGIPWEGTLGSPRDSVGGEPMEPQAEDKQNKLTQLITNLLIN